MMCKDTYLRSQGVESTDIFFDMGIFVILIAIILLAYLVYLGFRLAANKFACCRKLMDWLKKYLFYRAPLRYVVVGYLRLLSLFSALFTMNLANELIGASQIQDEEEAASN